MLLLTQRTNQDLLALPHCNRPRRCTLYRIGLHAFAPITRHDLHHGRTRAVGPSSGGGDSEALVARNWINEVQRAPKEQGQPPFRRRPVALPGVEHDPTELTLRRAPRRAPRSRSTAGAERDEELGGDQSVRPQDRLQLRVEAVAGVDRVLAAQSQYGRLRACR